MAQQVGRFVCVCVRGLLSGRAREESFNLCPLLAFLIKNKSHESRSKEDDQLQENSKRTDEQEVV